MISRTWSRKSIAFCLAVAVLSVYSMVVLATPGQMGQTGPSGELSVTGQVTVNGQTAISGATVFSDSTVQTAQNSSAVVSLGKLGRVELLPGSTMKLSFSETSVTGMLDSGRARISTPAGVSASITTKDGSAVADSKQANVFTVDTECGNTVVATQAGNVELRAGDKTMQIAAGTQDTAGTAAPGTRCTRLKTEGMKGLSGGALAALLLAAGGAIAAAILAGRSENNDLNFGGTVTVVSPTK
jgi:phage baseplate assembly protein gpV